MLEVKEGEGSKIQDIEYPRKKCVIAGNAQSLRLKTASSGFSKNREESPKKEMNGRNEMKGKKRRGKPQEQNTTRPKHNSY